MFQVMFCLSIVLIHENLCINVDKYV